MDREYIIKSFVDFTMSELKIKHQREEERKQHWIFDYDIDPNYLAEIMRECFEKGVLIEPTNQEELVEFQKDVLTNLIINDSFPRDNLVVCQKGEQKRGAQTFLQTLLEESEKNKLSYPEFFIKVPFEELVDDDGIVKRIEQIVKNGESFGTSKQLGKYHFDDESFQWLYKPDARTTFSDQVGRSKWVKGKINLRVEVKEGQQITTDMIANLGVVMRHAMEVSHFDLDNVEIVFGQKEIDSDKARYRYDGVTLSQLQDINEDVERLGGKLIFSEINTDRTRNKNTWTFEQVKRANHVINELANRIKKEKMSPLEAIVYVCTWSALNIQYGNGLNDRELMNTIVSAVNNQKVQCVGFAEFANAVLNSAGFDANNEMGTLLAKKITCTTAKDKHGNILPDHCQSLLSVVDKKYHKKGDYICDVNLTNLVGSISDIINNALQGSGQSLDVKPLNSLCLRTLAEYKGLLPDYTIFPYSKGERCAIEGRTQIDVEDIRKYENLAATYSYLKPDEFRKKLEEEGVSFSFVPKKVDGVEYDEYMRQSSEIMDKLKRTQADPVKTDEFMAMLGKVAGFAYADSIGDIAQEKSAEEMQLLLSGSELFNELIEGVVHQQMEHNSWTKPEEPTMEQ